MSRKRLDDLEVYGVEALWFQINLKHSKPITVGFIYRNPDETVDWYDKFCEMMDAASLRDQELIILGDFNLDMLKPQSKWTLTFKQYKIEQVIDRPTHILEKTETIIDHIYVSTREHVIESCAPPVGCSDHSSICLTWVKTNVKIPKP